MFALPPFNKGGKINENEPPAPNGAGVRFVILSEAKDLGIKKTYQ